MKPGKKCFIVMFVLVLALSFAVTGCGDGTSSDTSGKSSTAVSEKKDVEKTEDTEKKASEKEKKESSEKKTEKKEKKETEKRKGSKASKKKQASSEAEYCTVKIVCSTLSEKKGELSESLEKLVPSSGIILSETKVRIKKGETGLDVSARTAKAKGIHFSYQGADVYGTGYVDGINNIYEKDYCSKSGWMFMLNGSVTGKGAAAYKVKNGDRIVWAYSCNMGKDL